MGVEDGLQAWRQGSNHNRMMALQGQAGAPEAPGRVEVAYFGSSAFRITTPMGVTVMLDPWRNLPTGKWDWYFHDFPQVAVDVGVSTHAHFDHDALHLLDAHVLLDRPIGRYEIADLRISAIADKHAIDDAAALYRFRQINTYFGGQKLVPPDNARSWDNALVLVECGGLRILHWGDNRAEPPQAVWDALGRIDLLLMPADDSQHVLSYAAVEAITERLSPKVLIPHHYYIWNVVQRGSTLLPVDGWLAKQANVVRLDRPTALYAPDTLPDTREIHHFGDHVAFDVAAWHAANGLGLSQDPESAR